MTKEQDHEEKNTEKLIDKKLDRRNFLKRSSQTFGALMAAGLFKFNFSTKRANASEGDLSDKLIILHTNDMHGRIEINPDDGIMGMPYVSSIVKDFRENYENVLLLDAGDTIHGRPITDRLYGSSAIDTMNVIGYDVMTAGNHDFNFGYDRLLELEEMMNAELVSANVEKDGELLFKPYTIREIAGRQIGILGLATPATRYTTHPDNIEGLDFTSMREATEHYVEEMRSEYDLDLLITLGHVGYGANNPDDEDFTVTDELVKNVDGIDLFVDGHSHTRIPEGDWHNDTLVVQAYEYLKKVGVVEIDLSNDQPEFQAHLISAEEAIANYEPDPELEEIISDARDEAREALLG